MQRTERSTCKRFMKMVLGDTSLVEQETPDLPAT